MTDLERRWEARLKREGLGSLDCAAGDDVVVSNAGAGKLKDETAQAHREASEAEMERRRGILRRGKFATKLERRIWTLHADGIGWQRIARKVGKSQWHVRHVIARPPVTKGAKVTSRRALPTLIRRSDTGILLKTLEALWHR